MYRRTIIITLSALLIVLTGCGKVPSAQTPTQPQPAAVPETTTPVPAPSIPVVSTPPAPASSIQPLAAIQFIDSQTGWAVGNGQIIGTTDGGKTWREQERDSADYSGVDFADANNGWAWGRDVFMTTHDGGKSWKAASPPDSSGVPSNVQFTSATHGWATQNDALYEVTPNWQKVTTPGPVQSFCFADDARGWAAGGKAIYQTRDGGKTWQTAFTAPLEQDGWTNELHCGGDAAWVLYRGSGAASQQAYVVFRTLDGASWQPVLKEAFFSSLYPTANDVKEQIDAYSGAFQVINPNVALFLGRCPACVAPNTLSLTTTRDGGKTFSHATIPVDAYVTSASLYFTDADHGWVAVGPTLPGNQGGMILATTDGGKNWTQVLPVKP